MFAGDQNGLQGDPRLKAISEAIRVVPHFPKQGIMFQDITTLLLDHKAFKDTVDIFVDRYRDMGISVVAGEVISEAYVLEYGTDCLEMHVGAVQPGERAVVIDDLVATGGTLSAAIRLLERAGAEVVECACVVGLREVKGHHGLNGKPLYILVEPRQQINCSAPSEKNLQLELAELEIAETNFYKQKAKVDWIREGDQRTKFFHVTVAAKNKRNTINFLLNEDGQRLNTFESISEELLQFYTKQIGTADDMVLECNVDSLKSILDDNLPIHVQENLIQAVNREEIIYQSLLKRT